MEVLLLQWNTTERVKAEANSRSPDVLPATTTPVKCVASSISPPSRSSIFHLEFVTFDRRRTDPSVTHMDHGTRPFMPGRSPECACILPIWEYGERAAMVVADRDPVAIEDEACKQNLAVGETLHLERPLPIAKESDSMAAGGVARARAIPARQPKSEVMRELVGRLEPGEPVALQCNGAGGC